MSDESEVARVFEAVDKPSQACVSAGSAMRADVHVHEPSSELGGVFQLVAHQADGSSEELVVRSGQVDEIGGVDRDRPDVQLDEPPPKRLRVHAAKRTSAPRSATAETRAPARGASRPVARETPRHRLRILGIDADDLVGKFRIVNLRHV